jgi:DNA-binding LytR/AlgR family response regulator
MNRALKIFIVEDEYINRIHLKKSLEKMGHEVKGQASSAQEAIDLLKSTPVDLMILDINLGKEEKDGIWIGEYVSTHYNIPFIYLTAYGTESIVKRAINTSPYAYLTKPFNEVELSASMELAMNRFYLDNKKIETKEIIIGNEKVFTKINSSEIYYIESQGNYVHIHTVEKIYKERTTLLAMLNKLQKESFLQIHRSFVVNINKVEKITPSKASIADIEIPITRNHEVLMNGILIHNK